MRFLRICRALFTMETCEYIMENTKGKSEIIAFYGYFLALINHKDYSEEVLVGCNDIETLRHACGDHFSEETITEALECFDKLGMVVNEEANNGSVMD